MSTHRITGVKGELREVSGNISAGSSTALLQAKVEIKTELAEDLDIDAGTPRDPEEHMDWASFYKLSLKPAFAELNAAGILTMPNFEDQEARPVILWTDRETMEC